MPKPHPARGDHSRCDHVYRLVPQGLSPLPWNRQRLVFKSHCLVTNRWVRVSMTRPYFWSGDKAHGETRVETGELDPVAQIQVQDETLRSSGPRSEEGPFFRVGGSSADGAPDR